MTTPLGFAALAAALADGSLPPTDFLDAVSMASHDAAVVAVLNGPGKDVDELRTLADICASPIAFDMPGMPFSCFVAQIHVQMRGIAAEIATTTGVDTEFLFQAACAQGYAVTAPNGVTHRELGLPTE
jgi:hypothetical protein